MINYALAKRLKDAGFPQTHTPMDGPVAYESSDYKGSNEWASAPTLSELIEACGESFGALTSYKDNECVSPDWGARSNVSAMHIMGTTPEEAVANLWLALNEKKV